MKPHERGQKTAMTISIVRHEEAAGLLVTSLMLATLSALHFFINR